MNERVERSAVTPDGAPVEVYRELPFSPEFDPLVAALHPGSSVLDLGSGTGRLANGLVAEGHPVVAGVCAAVLCSGRR